MNSTDTIFALSSGGLPSGLAVIRLSGPQARFGIETICGVVPAERFAKLAVFRNPLNGEELDRGLVLWFAAPASFTGEDIGELHCHGGMAVVDALLEVLALLPGFRMAEAGEFSRRAFVNGKFDLTQLEGLADLVASQTEQQRRQAVALSGGLLRQRFDGWREQIAGLRALVEADFDFSDEGDVSGSVADSVWPLCKTLADAITAFLDDRNHGEIVRSGYQVVLMGKPNAGKSSLLNALARRDIAIVSAEAGTTRDVLEVWLDIAGYKVCIADTAGIRAAEGSVEREGVRRAMDRAGGADLVLWLSEDGSGPDAGVVPEGAEVVAVRSKDDAGVFTKASVSVQRGDGLDWVNGVIAARLAACALSQSGTGVSRERHRYCLQECLAMLKKAGEAGQPQEVRAEQLRAAGDAIGRLTGAIGVEEVLGRIFSEFCIGK